MTVTKMAAVVVSVLHVPVTALGLVVGLGLDTVTHYRADRRTGLARDTSVLDQAANRDRSDVAGCRNRLRQGEADVDQR